MSDFDSRISIQIKWWKCVLKKINVRYLSQLNGEKEEYRWCSCCDSGYDKNPNNSYKNHSNNMSLVIKVWART